MAERTITTYEGTLEVDGEPGAVSVSVAGLAHEHERDSGIVRRALREGLARYRTAFPQAKRLSLTVRVRGGTDIREEYTA